MIPRDIPMPDINTMDRDNLIAYAHISMAYELGDSRYYIDEKVRERLSTPEIDGGPSNDELRFTITASQDALKSMASMRFSDRPFNPWWYIDGE